MRPSPILPFVSDVAEDVHLLNPLWDPHGGADRRTADLYRLLAADRQVQLWSEHRVAPAFRDLPVRRVRPWRRPRKGVLIVVGVYFPLGRWIRRCDSEIVIVYNTEQPDRLTKTLSRIGDRPVRVVFTSRELRRRSLDDPTLRHLSRALLEDAAVLESFVDPTPFSGLPSRESHEPFTVGRLSRDRDRKHHPDDPSVYASLATLGMRVRVMGGTSLREQTPRDDRIELLPAGQTPAPEFLATLDAFIYRTHPDYFEAFGRVVLEAMLCGLPVVVESRGGYARHIVHGENGFLFERPTEALGLLAMLRDDPALRRRVGAAARASTLRFFADDLSRRTVTTLLGGPPVAPADAGYRQAA